MRNGKERQQRRLARLRRRCRSLLGACVLLFAGPVPGMAAEIQVVLADETPYYAEALTSLRDRLEELLPGAVVRTQADSGKPLVDGDEADLLVTIGSKALGAARAASAGRGALHLFVTRDDWQQQAARDPGLTQHSALVLDQPPVHLVALARALLPKARVLAIVVGPVGRRHLEEVRDEAENLGFEPLIGTLDANDNPLAVLSPLVRVADAVLVVPDDADFNSAMAKWLLQLSFRARAPVIAFSNAYVRAGALASIFTAPQDVGREGAELIAAGLPAGGLPREMQLPRRYSLAINRDVAQALGIEVPDEAVCRQRIDAILEGRP